MSQSKSDKSDSQTQGTRKRSWLLRLGAIGCAIFAIIVAAPVIVLLTHDGRYEMGEWGMRWLPANYAYASWVHGISSSSEGVSSNPFGGKESTSGTTVTIPPGLVQTQFRQLGRLQWWHNHVVKQPGTYSQRDVQALTQEVMPGSVQYSGGPAKRNKHPK
jgi:hypothetical protein